MPQFSRRTILAATDILANWRHANISRFLLEHTLEGSIENGSCAVRGMNLARYLMNHPDYPDQDGGNLTDTVIGHTTDKSRSRAKFGGTVAAPKRKAHSKGKTRSNRNANSRPPLRQAADNLPSGKGAIRSSARKAKPAVPVPRRREALANVGGFRVAPERVRPSYFPILRAYIQLLEEGKAPTYANIARIVGGHRNTIQQLFQRHPDLWGWLARHVEGSIGHYVPAVLLRHAHLAIQGSVESAKLYLSAMGVNGARGHLSEEGDGPEDSRYVTHVNILVPHPQLPNGGRMPPLGNAPTSSTVPPLLPNGERVPELGSPSAKMPNLQDIPTVAVR